MLIRRLPLLIALLLGLSAPLRATHIVGGEMTYTCLGGDSYEIVLTVFRDCFNGNPNAWFDNPASIGIFNADNELLEQVLVPLMNNDTLSPVLNSPCLVVPPNVCVHTTTYRTVVELPPIPGGYQLAYQRCCRNQTIVNIVDPLDTGATFGVTITEEALNACNSSPRFQEWPPIYICANEPIVFDQSATDSDGDSIVYRLCTPLTGADPEVPQPQPPNAPPYDEIVWVAPTYGEQNMLNGFPGGVPLQINGQTGLLTGLPNTIGQFVVGVCAEEYRDGVLLSTIRRDFQYNVGLCGVAEAAFAAPEVQCGSLTVSFENQSTGATGFEWQFNDPGSPGSVSSLPNPVYTFSDTGRYEVLLIAAPGEVCEDTFVQEVLLQPETLLPDFDLAITGCADTALAQASDQSTALFSSIIEREWLLEPQGQTAFGPSPSFALTASGEYNLTLFLTAANGCSAAVTRSFEVELLGDALGRDTLQACPGDSLFLNPAFNPSLAYSWEGPGIVAPSSPNPQVLPTESGSYAVTITNAAGTCSFAGAVEVVVRPQVMPLAPADTLACTVSYTLLGEAENGVSLSWYKDPELAQLIGEGSGVTVYPIGPQVYYLQGRDEAGCTGLDSVLVDGRAVRAVLTTVPAVCPGELATAVLINQQEGDTLSYQWSPEEHTVFGTQNAILYAALPSPGSYTYTVLTQNQYGCTRTDSVTFVQVDTASQAGFQTAQQCSGYNVQFASASTNAPLFLWQFGDPSNPNAFGAGASTAYTYPGPGTYTVRVTLPGYLSCPDTLYQEVVVGEPQVFPAFDFEVTACSDSIVLQLNDASQNLQSEIVMWEWALSNGLEATGPNPAFVIYESGDILARLRITSADGCVDEHTGLIPIAIPDPALPDTLLACPGTPISLNPSPLPGFAYTWSPSALFSDPTAPSPVVEADSTQHIQVVLEEEQGICRLERDILLQVPPQPAYVLSPDTAVCSPSVTLSVAASSGNSLAWSYSPFFTPLLSDQPVVEVPAAGENTFYFRLTDPFGCVQLDSVQVTGSSLQVFVPDLVQACAGDTARVEVVPLIPGQELVYHWEPEGALLSGQGTPVAVLAGAEDVDLRVEIMDQLGCWIERLARIRFSEEGVAATASAQPIELFEAGTVQLQANEGPGLTYSWQPPGLLDNPSAAAPMAFIDTTTLFTVTVEGQNGCRGTAEVWVRVLTECLPPYIFVPNAFTPDGDGLNDELKVLGGAIDEMEFRVYNRWGEEVFYSDNPAYGWDGAFRGQPLPPDVYGYYLEVRCFNGDLFQDKGNITLLR